MPVPPRLSAAAHTLLTLIRLPSGMHFQREGIENVLLGSITLYWKNNGISLECFPRECLHVLFVYFKLQMRRRVMVGSAGGTGCGGNLHFEHSDICRTDYLFKCEVKGCLS